MSVAARFYIASVTTSANGSAKAGQRQGSVAMNAVCRGPENRSWSSATPSGEFKVTITNPSAFEWFLENIGAEVAITVDLRPAICEVCHEEVLPGYDNGPGEGGTGGLGDTPFTHQRCVA